MLYFINQLQSLTRDFIKPAKPEQILDGGKMFRPFMSYQKAWLNSVHPGATLCTKTSTWFYLQQYIMPLIRQHASSYHVEGIKSLKLDGTVQPDFKEFQDLFYHVSHGFQIQPVCKEIAPEEYFTLISQKKFPCVPLIRPHNELFCANEPDFWHEAIGHIAPLCFPEVQEFYLGIAHHILTAKTKLQRRQHLAVAWTLMEYGFIQENEQHKMFGAALVGSHLANMRYINGLIAVEPAERHAILDSGFYDEDAPLAKNHRGALRFFCLNNLHINSLLFP